MVINREALHEVDLAMADAMEAMAVDVVGRVRPPDAAPFGEGLVESGGYVTYVDGRKVGGGATKPRSMRVRGRGVVTATGYGFPGYFQEVGTVNQPPRPFLAPVVMDVMGDRGAVEGAMRAAFSRRRSLARPR
jgi:hypothetical protein